MNDLVRVLFSRPTPNNIGIDREKKISIPTSTGSSGYPQRRAKRQRCVYPEATTSRATSLRISPPLKQGRVLNSKDVFSQSNGVVEDMGFTVPAACYPYHEVWVL